MYRLTLNSKAYGKFDDERRRYETYDAETTFDCQTVQQLTGLLEFMIATSTNVLDLRISRREDDD